MDVAQAACALSGRKHSRHAAFWRMAERKVRKLQVRIAKAVMDGKQGRVKVLQWLLTHSYFGRLLAVRRVSSNKGRKTPGVDGVVWSTPRQKMLAVAHLRRRGYRPKPLRRVYIRKRNGKLRPLGIPTIRDRAMQALHALALVPIAEATADRHSYGFRPRRSCADAIGQCFIALSRWYSPQWILEGDICGCFDTISHQWMLENIPTDGRVLKAWLESGYVDGGIFHVTEAGTPQGGVISPILANMALDGLERVCFGNTGLRARCRRPAKFNVVRYADDFIITGSSEQFLREQVIPAVEAFLRPRGLVLSEEKTRITYVEEGFDFLGQRVRKTRGALTINPSRGAIRALMTKCKGLIKTHGASNAELIHKLNPVLRGWANYHRHIYASRTFEYVDQRIFGLVWSWLKTQQRAKGKRWRAHNNFTRHRGRNWTLCGRYRTVKGAAKTAYLLRMATLRNIPYAKIRAAAQPFDRKWDEYFAKRQNTKYLSVSERRLKQYPTPCGV